MRPFLDECESGISAKLVAESVLKSRSDLSPEISKRLKWLQVRRMEYNTRKGDSVSLLCLTYLIQAYTNSRPLFDARGLYLRIAKNASTGEDQWVVAMRGYDKFTTSRWICAAINSSSPTAEPDFPGVQCYEVVEKVNGCLVMASSICGEIFVATKNAGDVGPLSGSHAIHARKLIREHLSRAGRTEGDLSDYLCSENVTFALELVDDAFEEHIVEYDPEKSSGLYLHGINENIMVHRTRSLDEVSTAAKTFGFLIPTYRRTSRPEDILDICKRYAYPEGSSGFVEGYVIRSFRGDTVHFEKYKTPLYLMCREWKNVARKCAVSQSYNINKLKFALSYIFLFWVHDAKRRGLPELTKDLSRGFHGVRRKFLSFMDSSPRESGPDWGRMNTASFVFKLCSAPEEQGPCYSSPGKEAKITTLSSAYRAGGGLYPCPPSSFGKGVSFVILANCAGTEDLEKRAIQMSRSADICVVESDHPSCSSVHTLIIHILTVSLTARHIFVKKCIVSARSQDLIRRKLKYVYPACSLAYLGSVYSSPPSSLGCIFETPIFP